MTDDVFAADGRVIGSRALVTRRKLLDATAKLLQEQGILDLRVVDISRDVGSSPATFYQYFNDVDEAILLSDKILLMSNGPRAHIAEIVKNTMPRNRTRETMHHDPQYYGIRNHLIDFLVRRSKLEKEPVMVGHQPTVVSPGLLKQAPDLQVVA